MLTKYFIEIDGQRTEIPNECIKNWDEVRCAYKRADFSGVTRSFSSQFEFVGDAYDMLMALYLRDGFNAVATLYLYTITDRWVWEERFAAPIDFSTIVWDNNILKVNCVDNSLAALIKANKSTKYEFGVGSDIPIASQLNYDRIPMTEVVSYQVIGETIDDSSTMKLSVPGALGVVYRIPVNIITENVLVNEKLLYNDQTTDDGSYMVSAKTDVTITIKGGIAIDMINACQPANFGVTIYKTSNDVTTKIGPLCSQSFLITYRGEYDKPGDLPILTPATLGATAFVKQTNTIWKWWVNEASTSEDNLFIWMDSKMSSDEYMRQIPEYTYSVDLKEGDKIWIGAEANPGLGSRPGPFWILMLDQKIEISWGGIGKSAEIDVIRPLDFCEKILNRISMGKVNVGVTFSDFDNCLANTYLLAAESVRGIGDAKIYSSFTEFVDWMQTVFGYTYCLGPRTKAQFKRKQSIFYNSWPISANDNLLHTMCPVEPGTQVVIIQGTPYCAVLGDYNSDGGNNYYTKWEGSDAYNDPKTGKARLDTIFIGEDKEGCYFDSNYNLHIYDGNVEMAICDNQVINFIHRSELFKSDASTMRINNVRDVSYSVDSSSIYSAITIGYEKQDYEGFNGRDEFNFNNTYSTGHTVNDKKLSLISKYRADCYGIEFAVQKRGQDTTDSSSDKDVFFVLSKSENGLLIPDRTIRIENTISDMVFNGAFSPIACIQANAGFIGIQAKHLHLEFASSMGNSSIVIDGRAMSEDIDLDAPLMTCGRVSFTTDEIDEPASENNLIEIESNGILYRGFVKDATFKYATNEAVKYELIVKDIEL